MKKGPLLDLPPAGTWREEATTKRKKSPRRGVRDDPGALQECTYDGGPGPVLNIIKLIKAWGTLGSDLDVKCGAWWQGQLFGAPGSPPSAPEGASAAPRVAQDGPEPLSGRPPGASDGPTGAPNRPGGPSDVPGEPKKGLPRGPRGAAFNGCLSVVEGGLGVLALSGLQRFRTSQKKRLPT